MYKADRPTFIALNQLQYEYEPYSRLGHKILRYIIPRKAFRFFFTLTLALWSNDLELVNVIYEYDTCMLLFYSNKNVMFVEKHLNSSSNMKIY